MRGERTDPVTLHAIVADDSELVASARRWDNAAWRANNLGNRFTSSRLGEALPEVVGTVVENVIDHAYGLPRKEERLRAISESHGLVDIATVSEFADDVLSADYAIRRSALPRYSDETL